METADHIADTTTTAAATKIKGLTFTFKKFDVRSAMVAFEEKR